MRKLLTITLLVACLLSAFLTVDVASAHTVRPATCTYWSTDVEQFPIDNGYRWDISLLSFRECGTGRYLGKVSDHNCVTMPSQVPIFLRFWNMWYSGQPWILVGENTVAWSPPTPGKTYCLYSGSYYVSAHHDAAACGALELADATYTSTACVYDYNIAP